MTAEETDESKELADELSALIRDASIDGKLIPARHKAFRDEAVRAGGGSVTRESIAWAKAAIAEMPYAVVTPARAARPPVPPETPAKPNWGKWSAMLEATAHDAVALACDIDPEVFRGKNGGIRTGEALSRFFDRLDVAKNHIQNGRLPTLQRPTSWGDENKIVDMATFAAWAEGPPMKWSLPAEFPRDRPAEPPLSAPNPLRTRERNNLLLIIAAMSKDKGIDLSRPTLAARDIRQIVQEQYQVSIGETTVMGYLEKIDAAVAAKLAAAGVDDEK